MLNIIVEVVLNFECRYLFILIKGLWDCGEYY